jgi:hypothetical protein
MGREKELRGLGGLIKGVPGPSVCFYNDVDAGIFITMT